MERSASRRRVLSLISAWSGSSTTNLITVTTGSASVSGIISVKANNTCGSSAAQTLSVTVNAIPAKPATIAGPSYPCSGTSTAYSIAPVAYATSYNWIVPTGASIQGAQNGTNITVLWGSTGGYVKVQASSSCGNSSFRTRYISVTNCRGAQEETAVGVRARVQEDVAQTGSRCRVRTECDHAVSDS